MSLTPFIYQRSARLAFDLGKLLGMGGGHPGQKKTHLSNHVIIIGYGLNGRNLARVLKETGIPHAIMEMNMERVKAAKAEGHSAYFGDASHPEVFKKLGVEKAKMVVTAISDPISTRAIVKTAREISPTVSIIVRTRFVKEVEDLYRLGANQVIPEEFETSVEIFARVLRDYRVPTNIIQNQIDLIRQEGYAMLRNLALSTDRLSRLSAILEKTVMDTFYVDDVCSVAGSTLRDLDFRKRTGATGHSHSKGERGQYEPRAGFQDREGGHTVLLGSHAQLAAAFQILNEKCPVTKA
ncbi:MAG: NAD-binding protein [Thermodesulfobacteriota bacterium]|nr:MAG: NAD-binding protein [Thermodesulfobacteriota bacterium]